MSIKPIDTTIEKNSTALNETGCKKSHTGVCCGLATGTLLSGALVGSQLRTLNTVRGKKNLIESLQIDEIALKQLYPRTVLRSESGKPVVPASGITERTRKIVGSFKKELFSWGAGILLLATGLGALADKSISVVNQKEALREASDKK